MALIRSCVRMVSSTMIERVRKMRTDVEKKFKDLYRAVMTGGAQGMVLAPMDMYESESEIIAKFDIPGIEKSDIDVQVSNNVLEVKAEKTEEREEMKEGAHMMERAYRGYYRQVPLPTYGKSEGVKAEYKDGTLTVHIPKDEERVKRTQVPVE